MTTSASTSPPALLTPTALANWLALTQRGAPIDNFILNPGADLPVPVRRWLDHTLPANPGTPVSVELWMHGRIKLGRWMRFEARQILAPTAGFCWAARVHGPAGIRIAGFDRLGSGVGEMRWRLFGVLPLINAAGPDVSRSAAGRLAGEFVMMPTFALHPSVVWEAVDDHSARAHLVVAGHPHVVTVVVGPGGALTSVSLPRWGNPGGGAFREHRFTACFEDEKALGDHLVPARISAGWEGAGVFIRYGIDRASYR